MATERMLIDACLNCRITPDCDDEAQGCLFRILTQPEYTESMKESQRRYRERNKEKYRGYWLKAYYRRKEKRLIGQGL